MKELLSKVNNILKPFGYRKNGASFWKIENEVYKLVDFQKGTYKGDYFFINLCVHPVGLPKLMANQFLVVDRPKEYECIVRQRIEQVVKNDAVARFAKGLASCIDHKSCVELLEAISKEADQWLDDWGRLDKLANASKEEILNMLTVVPNLKEKAFYMLKFYCFMKLSEIDKAENFLSKYLSLKIDGLNFNALDDDLKKHFERLKGSGWKAG